MSDRRSLLAAALLTGSLVPQAMAQRAAPTPPALEPQPVRHDLPRDLSAASEFLVLRHQRLEPGSHERFYELSRDGVWPYFEKIGARVVGQWQVVHPEAEGGEAGTDFDEGYRLARYRSFEHWAATRRAAELGGNGPDYLALLEALRARGELLLGSDGPIYLEGRMAQGGPFYFPPLAEPDELIPSGSRAADASSIRPVRHGTPVPGREIVTLRFFKIKKGAFEEFHRLSAEGVWPYFEKMGARVIGQWRVVYPEVRGDEGPGVPLQRESPEYDQAYMAVRYASFEHWQATRPAVMAELGGDGRDYEACREALRRRAELTLESSVRFLQGYFHGSPPVYLPALDETGQR